MSITDQEVILKALSVLTGVTAKPHTSNSSFRSKSSNSKPQLDIYNLIPTALLGQNDPQGGYRCMDLEKEVFVNMTELLDPRYDYDFRNVTNNSLCQRGGEPYKRPCGWYRIALKVLNKYPDGNVWLGTDGMREHSVAGEWPVSYHGTSCTGAEGIASSSYKPGGGQIYGRGIYSTYDIEEACSYSKQFTKNGKTYNVILQNRVNPKMRKQCEKKEYWLIEIPEGTTSDKEKEIVEKSIRPYGILLKEV
ncbi:uncharacterized protein [Garra rufa]|uniref:uncharacterized protein n=1 Tax=Garra rufa TaxID=137080 RepID=UPI003CCEB065